MNKKIIICGICIISILVIAVVYMLTKSDKSYDNYMGKDKYEQINIEEENRKHVDIINNDDGALSDILECLEDNEISDYTSITYIDYGYDTEEFDVYEVVLSDNEKVYVRYSNKLTKIIDW